ncbi:TIGR01244 family phosphatase [Rhodobacteraceae bacterium SC52]|nr:TIGR01244 family phosphatase [Rhodobacteraceae bacterium SC52]
MDIRQLSPDYAVSPQIDPTDAGEIAAAGYTTVICNRPDAEIPGNLQADVMRTAVEQAGLTFVVNPVVPGGMGPATLDAQAQAISAATGPVLAYCASGNRSAIVWSLLNAGTIGVDGVLAATRAAGYDHSPFRPQFEMMTKG